MTARQEVETEQALNPRNYIIGELALIGGLSKGESFNIRRSSSHIKNALSTLQRDWREETTDEDRKEIAEAATNALAALSKNTNDTSYTYYAGLARREILEGLGQIEDPHIQIVIASGLDDPQEQVRKVSRDLLMRNNIKIFPKTLKFLLEAKDPKDVTATRNDPEKIELALSIVEHNESAGHDDGYIDPAVRGTLLDVFSGRKEILGGKHRAAVIAGRLYSMTPDGKVEVVRDDLFNKVELHLLSEVVEEVESMQSREKFDELVNTICTTNLSSAKTADDVSEMDLILPPEPEVIGLLPKMDSDFDWSNYGDRDNYRQIRALASQEARKKLQNTINRSHEEEKRIADKRKVAELGMMEEKRKKRESDLEAKRRELFARIQQERDLAESARKSFPGISISNVGNG